MFPQKYLRHDDHIGEGLNVRIQLAIAKITLASYKMKEKKNTSETVLHVLNTSPVSPSKLVSLPWPE